MKFRQRLKHWLYGYCPGFAGTFPYFAKRVHFPKGSLSFKAACEQGIFEADNVRLLQALTRPETCMFDVGTNIGLMAIPVLQAQPQSRVISFEPSPNVLDSLRRTVAGSDYQNRWTLIEKAVGAESGKVAFSLSDQANSLFDGIRPTDRVASIRQIEVELTTLDDTWRALGSPKVSVIKIDVEGGELDVLLGARECLKQERPSVLVEWNRQNLTAYSCAPELLITFVKEASYKILSVPSLAEVGCKTVLAAHMAFTENFLLIADGATS
jgi:FkbM family methyltransferase